MKLSLKFPLVQIIIIILFSLALWLTLFVFKEMSHYSEQNIILYELNYEIQILRDELNLITYRPQPPNASFYDLNGKVTKIETLIKQMEYFTGSSDSKIDSITFELNNFWDMLYSNELLPLLAEMRSLDPLAGYYTLSVYGMRGSLLEFQLSGSDQLYKTIEHILNQINKIYPQVDTDLVNLAKETAEKMDLEINNFSVTMIKNALLAMASMMMFSLILAWSLSHSIGLNMKRLDEAVNQVASGNFNFAVTSSSNDEFREIAVSFNTLTEMLWFRLDSLKDLMRDLGSAIENESSTDELYTLILELAIDSTGADSALIMLFDEEQKGLVMAKQLGYFPPPMEIPRSVRMKQESMANWLQTTTISLKDNILGEICARGSSLFIHDNTKQSVLSFNRDRDSFNFINSAIFLSLKTSEKQLGVIGLAKTKPNDYFNDLDFTYMKSYANFVTITLDNFDKYQELILKHEINREIEVAAEIQTTLLPARMPPMKISSIAAFSHAAKGVSGDYYDVFNLDSKRTAVIICDISGKGIPASLFMVMFRTVIRTLSKPEMNSSEILTAVNREISSNFQSGTFATASFLIIDHLNHNISYSNGAHHPLYIYRKAKENFVKFDTEGLPLGIDIRGTYGHKQIKINKGDYLFLFTDGLTEARNPKGEELGTGRLLKYASKYVDKSPERMNEMINELLVKFKGSADQHDDETFLSIKIDS
jgi:sigma-B regulation protein RsbU (phosphoserine phosphatase)